MDGCGVFILRRAMVLRVGLEGVRRRATERRRGDEALRPRRARRQAFLLTPRAALIAHLGSLLTLTISRLRVDSGIKVGLLLTYSLSTVGAFVYPTPANKTPPFRLIGISSAKAFGLPIWIKAFLHSRPSHISTVASSSAFRTFRPSGPMWTPVPKQAGHFIQAPKSPRSLGR